MKIESGKLDRRIRFLVETKTKSATGQQKSEWVASTLSYAQRLELRTSDIARVAGNEAVATGRYLLRYRDGVKVGQRVRIDDETYQITAVDEPDRRATLIIMVEAVA